MTIIENATPLEWQTIIGWLQVYRRRPRKLTIRVVDGCDACYIPVLKQITLGRHTYTWRREVLWHELDHHFGIHRVANYLTHIKKPWWYLRTTDHQPCCFICNRTFGASESQTDEQIRQIYYDIHVPKCIQWQSELRRRQSI